MLLPLSTDKVDPEVMVTPSREELAIAWISAPLALVRLPPMIAEPLIMTDDEEPPVEMVPLVLVTTELWKYSVPPPVASSVPVFEVGAWMVSASFVPPGTLASTVAWLMNFKLELMAHCPWIVLSSFTRVGLGVVPLPSR